VRLKNTSLYPTEEVRALVEFAAKGIDSTGVMVHVKNSVRSSYRGMAYGRVPSMSRAYGMKSVDRLITLGIGPEHSFPSDNMIRWPGMVWKKISQEEVDKLNPEWAMRFVRWTHYSDGRVQASVKTQAEPHPYGGKGSPFIEVHDWREALVAVAAHEMRHHYQMKHHKRLSEVDAERHAAKMLERYRGVA
jgi:hypothetical protein